MRSFYSLALLLFPLAATAGPTLSGCPVLPANNIWNTPIDTMPRHPASDTFVNTIGATRGVHPDFGTVYEGAPIGIPYVVVPGTQPKVPVSFDYDDESDPGPYPVPPTAPVEGGNNSDGDRHVLVLDSDNCKLYELYYAFKNPNNSWDAGSGAIYDLRSNALRPDGWTSADAAGLPVLPGLVRYDEVLAGEINHALRFTVPATRNTYVWPARHQASSRTGAEYPPMGLRMRLKASFNITGFSPQVQVILRALKKYGMILADNGSAWYVSGVPDPRWNDDMLVGELADVKGSDFEAVDSSSLMVSPNSGEVKSAAVPVTEYYNTVLDHYFITASATEAQGIDAGAAGAGWIKPNAGDFKVWPSAAGPEWLPVCRFYGNETLGPNGKRLGPNSHFYTIEPAECSQVKKDPGWVFEGIAFYARRIEAGACPDPLRILYRAYNNGFPVKDSNHRFAVSLPVLQALEPAGWTVEGPAMCVE